MDVAMAAHSSQGTSAVTPAEDLFVLAIWAYPASTPRGGRSSNFMRAKLEERRGRAWQRFSRSWRPAESGKVQLCTRASEAGGTVQTWDGARNAIHAVTVAVQ